MVIKPMARGMVPLLVTVIVWGEDGTFVLIMPKATVVGAEMVRVPRFAVQLAFVPPFVPLQLQLHGPLPLTAEAEPAVQRFVAGVVAKVLPSALPQAPFVGSILKLAVMV